MRMKFLLGLLFVIVTPSWASLYPVVIPTTVDPGFPTHGLIQYNIHFVQKIMDIGPNGDIVVPVGKWVTVFWRNVSSTGGPDVAVTNTYSPFMSKGDGIKTYSELGLNAYNWQKAVYPSFSIIAVNDLTNVCIAWGGYSVAGSGFQPWSSVTTPGGCYTVPPAEEWCKITTPEILLDHGTISLQQAEGNTATAQLGVQCTTAMKVTFTLVGDDNYVYLDEGKSHLTVDDQPMHTPIDVPQGDSIHSVKDLLTGVTTEGAHTGSSVLIMQPY